MAIDFNKPIQTLDGDAAEKIRELTGTRYEHLILVTDGHDGSQSTVAIDDDGNSNEMNGFIENVEPVRTTTDIEELPEGDDNVVLDLPRGLQPRVMHSRRGPGRLVKIRKAPEGKPGKTVGIRLDSGDVSGDGGILWAFNKNVTLAD